MKVIDGSNYIEPHWKLSICDAQWREHELFTQKPGRTWLPPPSWTKRNPLWPLTAQSPTAMAEGRVAEYTAEGRVAEYTVGAHFSTGLTNAWRWKMKTIIGCYRVTQNNVFVLGRESPKCWITPNHAICRVVEGTKEVEPGEKKTRWPFIDIPRWILCVNVDTAQGGWIWCRQQNTPL